MPILIKCSGCGNFTVINPSCGARNCPRCMARRTRKLERRYLRQLMSIPNKGRGERWSFITLTGYRIPAIDRNEINNFIEVATRFLQKEFPYAGLGAFETKIKFDVVRVGSVESIGDFLGVSYGGPATLIDYKKSFFLHYHALVYGGWKSLQSKNNNDLPSRWFNALVRAGLITLDDDTRGDRRRAVKLESVKWLKKSVSYILKYVAKGIEYTDVEVEVLKRLKYIRTWGALYNPKELSYDLICVDCGAQCFASVFFDPIDFPESSPFNRLRIRLALKEEIAP